MAESKTLQEHQEAILNLRSKSLRLSYVLENFTEIRKRHTNQMTGAITTRGKPWPAYTKFLTDINHEELAIELCSENWAGKKCASQMMLMAGRALGWMRKTDYDFDDQWGLGRLLMSAFTYAGIYYLGKIDDYGKAPYYVLEVSQPLPEKQSKPNRTDFKPFPKWRSNIDQFGNTLVRPSYPCPPKYRFTPELTGNPTWLKAVHNLESVAFRINKEVLEWASDSKINRKLVPSDVDAKTKKEFAEIEPQKKQIEKLKREKYDKNNKKDPRHRFTKSEEKLWVNYWATKNRLTATYSRIKTRRAQFERDLQTAQYLAEDGRPFYHRVSVDYRGRVYLPTFSYQGSDFCRAVIEFADSGLMTKDAISQVARHAVNIEDKEKLSHNEKIKVGSDRGIEFAEIGISPDKHFKRIKEAGKPFCFYRTCIEWRDIFTHRLIGLRASKDSDDKKLLTQIKPTKKIIKWAEGHYKTLDLVAVKKKTHKGSGFYTAKDNKMLRSHLPTAADHRSSAFVHIGFMLNTEEGHDMVNKAMEEDLYQSIADRCTDLPPKHSRSIVKMVMVPWSYGGTGWRCKDKVSEWRLENAGKIPFLDAMSWSDLGNMVDTILGVLDSEFKASGQFRRALGRAVNKAKDRDDKEDWEGIEWATASKFVVHQATFKTKKKVNDVANGFDGEVQIRAKMPIDTMDWKKMESKTPPNLVHSQDATVVHELLAGGQKFVTDRTGKEEVFKYSPMVTVHDSFSVLPDDAENVLKGLEIVTMTSYRDDPLVQFGRSVIGDDFDIRADRSFRVGDYSYS